MPNKRGQNEGSIRKIERNGKTLWEARYSCGFDASGKRIQRSIYGKTRKECVGVLDTARGDLRDGTYVAPNKITLSAWAEKWLETYVKPTKREGTYINYRDYLKLQALPVLGARQLATLRPSDFQKLYVDLLDHGRIARKPKKEKLLKPLPEGHKRSGPPPKGKPIKEKPKGLAPATVKYIHVALHAACKQAVKEGILKINPIDACTAPSIPKAEMKVMDTEQLKIFLTEAKSSPNYCAYLISVSTGLRRGELLGLTWKNVNLKKGSLTICQQLNRTSKGLELTDVKSARSNRIVALPAAAIAELSVYKKAQAAEKLRLGTAYSKWDLVFCNPIGAPLDPNSFYSGYKRLLERAGLPPLRFHDLRHTYATLALERGAQPLIVSESLGHFSVGFTMDTYAHVTDRMRTEAADKLNAVFDEVLSK